VGAALGVARSIGGAAGRQLSTVATQSFIHAMSRALVLGSLVALMGAFVSLIWLPNRAEPDEEELRRIAELEGERDRPHHDGAHPVERRPEVVLQRSEQGQSGTSRR
jgi:hypothetical protein